MKQHSILFFLIAFFPNLNAQELPNKEIDVITNQPANLSNNDRIDTVKDFSFRDFTYDCNTVFWTINFSGTIQQWNLIGNQVSGGSSVQYCNGVSLAFCGEANSLTFYSTNYPSTGILKYVAGTGWVTIPTAIPLLNNAGFHENQYFFYYNNSSVQDLYHFDGTNLSLVAHLPGNETFAIADTAVDSLGRAWTFTGATTSSIDTLRIYDENGLVSSYPITFDGSYCYGAFFINDQLYIGVGASSMPYRQSLLPIVVNGTSASLGTPIPFTNYNYTDMASCNMQSPLSTNSTIYSEKDLLVYPNPTNGKVFIASKGNSLLINKVIITDVLGKTIQTKTVNTTNATIDLSDLRTGMYFAKVISDKGESVIKIVKQ